MRAGWKGEEKKVAIKGRKDKSDRFILIRSLIYIFFEQLTQTAINSIGRVCLLDNLLNIWAGLICLTNLQVYRLAHCIENLLSQWQRPLSWQSNNIQDNKGNFDFSLLYVILIENVDYCKLVKSTADINRNFFY